eukprot:GHRQ01024892.1.p1 GENE.GHRQ01024892.1~~GHRQ01024892.1.p1  ORF type:complete len:131 (+),score=26.52 GHRQ01024892.1:295-687(+)
MCLASLALLCLVIFCRVLVMERLSGVPLTDLASIRAVTSKDPEGVLISALNTWFASVLGADTFHADLHAGATRRGPLFAVRCFVWHSNFVSRRVDTLACVALQIAADGASVYGNVLLLLLLPDVSNPGHI